MPRTTIRRVRRLPASTRGIPATAAETPSRRPLPTAADNARAWAVRLRTRSTEVSAVTLTAAHALDLAVTLERLTREAR